MKIKTKELTGRGLDYAVQVAEGWTWQRGMPQGEWSALDECKQGIWWCSPRSKIWSCGRCHTFPEHCSSDWALGGLIIEREQLNVAYLGGTRLSRWAAEDGQGAMAYGPTPLIAAMRCYVASRLGEEVEVPDMFME